MPKSRKTSAANPVEQPARKRARKSAEPAKGNPRASEAAAPAPSEPRPAIKPARPSKKAAALALLQQPDSATVAELMGSTGWQAPTVRAVLTGFRKEGKELIRAKDDASATRYRLSATG